MVAYNSKKRIKAVSRKNKGVVVDMKNVELRMEVEREMKEEMMKELYANEVAMDVEVGVNPEALRQKEIVDNNIKIALHNSKNLGKRGILSKQYKSIVEGYKREVGFELSEVQCEFLKTITEEQAIAVIKVLNAYNRYKVNKDIQERMARKLATNE